MGCSTSRLDDEETVQICKDRKKFIKQAVEHRIQFASGHIAYIRSLRRISAALRDYIEGDEPRNFLIDSYTTPVPLTPVKKKSSGFISVSPKSFLVAPIESKLNSSLKINCLRSGGNPAVSVEERPQSPEVVRFENYSPIHNYGIDGFFAMQSSPITSFFSYSPNNRSNLPPPSPQTSQWDFFWNPFSSLDYYGYPTRNSLDTTILDDEITRLRQVREEEGIPDLEEETEQEESDRKVNITEERTAIDINSAKEEVIVEDDDDDDDDDDDVNNDEDGCDCGTEAKNDVKGLQSQLGSQSIEILSKAQNAGQVSNQETVVADREVNEETPGFTVYINRRPTCMAEVIKDLETQFMIVCDSAKEVSAMLEASRAQYSSSSNELTGVMIQRN